MKLELNMAVVSFGALVVLGQAGGPTTNLAQTLDLNLDGISDFEVIERETTYTFPGGLSSTFATWTLQAADHERARGNLLLTNSPVLAWGDLVPLDPLPPARWQTNGLLLLSAQISTGTGWGTAGPLTNTADVFLGVSLSATDGSHLAWLQARDTEARPGWRPVPRILGFGYQPVPEAAITVGDKPAPPVRDEVKTSVPVDLRGTG